MSKEVNIFIGSSIGGLFYAQCLGSRLNNFKDPEEELKLNANVWDEVFERKAPSRTNQEALIKELDSSDYGFFIVTPDYVHSYKDYPIYGAKPNIWFETGLFIGKLGFKRTFLISEKTIKIQNIIDFPSDYQSNMFSYEFDEFYDSPVQTYIKKCLNEYKEQISYENSEPKKRRQTKKLEKSLDEMIESQIIPNLKEFKPNVKFNPPITYIYDEKPEEAGKKCRQKAIEIIEESQNRIYTSNAFQKNKEADLSLWDWIIKKKLNNIKSRFEQATLRKSFKRYINLSVYANYTEARKILEDVGNSVEIKDTFCDFFELVVTDNKALIVFPFNKIVGEGILITEKNIVESLAQLFVNTLPEPKKIDFNSKEKLDSYRSINWGYFYDKKSIDNKEYNSEFPLAQKRGEKNSCLLCSKPFQELPEIVKNELRNKNLISNE